MNPLFISGIGRSGTSALLKSLAQHSKVVEPRKLGEAPFVAAFLEFLQNYEDASPNSDYNKKNYCLDHEAQKAIFRELLVRVQCGLEPADCPEGSVWIAKTSLPEHTYSKAEELFPAVRCIHIIRNGIEVVNSAKKFDGFKSLTFEALCRRWSGNIESCRFLFDKHGATQIRHDHLVSDPVTTYRKAFDKIGLAYDEKPAAWISSNLFNSSFDKSQSGKSVHEIFKNRLNDAWTGWSNGERETFLKICGPLMEEFSFDIPGGGMIPTSSVTKRRSNLRKTAGIDNKKVSAVFSESMNYEVFDYICNVSPKFNYFFVNNAKVASTSILKLLQENECIEAASKMSSPHLRDNSPLSRVSELSTEDQDKFLFSSEAYRFTFVRDPFSRILSAYKSKIERPLNGFKFDPEKPGSYPPKGHVIKLLTGKKISDNTDFDLEISFAEFVQIVCSQETREMDIHWKPQCELLCLDNIKYDFVGKFENLSKDIGLVAKRLGLSEKYTLSLSKNKTGSSLVLNQHFTPDLIKMVAEKYKRDFSVFGYREDSLTSKLVA